MTTVKSLFPKLIAHDTLSKSEARLLLLEMNSGNVSEALLGALMTVFAMRPITLDELQGFRAALLESCHAIDLKSNEIIDLCGTGGDGKHTLNVSTLASFVVAGAGFAVAKHGNYGQSSICGSSTVLELLGVSFLKTPEAVQKCFEHCGMVFMHAPLFHPSLKHVANARKSLGVKTFFNRLGPLVNPAQPSHQLIGVFALELGRSYQYLFQNTSTEISIVHALDGYDELSLTHHAQIWTKTQTYTFNPLDYNLPIIQPHEITGGVTPQASAKIFMDILYGNGTPAQNNVVCSNAALAFQTLKKMTFKEAFQMAETSLQSGKALASFHKLKNTISKCQN